MSLLAFDIGSSACKAVAFSSDGTVLSRHSHSYDPDFPAPSHAEMDAKNFWEAMCICSREAAKGLTDPVQAMCLSSHGESFVPVNARGEAVSPAILNQDNRAVTQTDWLEQQFGRKHLFEITGLVSHPMYSLPKIMWLKAHQPQAFSPDTRFVSVIGYLLLRLGLRPYIDFSLASRYLVFDVRECRWHDDILKAAGLSPEQLPIPVPAGTVAGELNAESAGHLGLPRGTKVVVGGHDQPCGALGLGAIEPGRVADSMGTYECLLGMSSAPVHTEIALANSLNSYRHVIPGKFATIAFFPSGIMMKWFHDFLYDTGGQQSSSDHYASMEANAPGGPTGLCITPNLVGTCNPDFNPHARAVIFGLTAETSRSHVYKGILEGIACEFSAMTKLLGNAIGDFGDVHVTGGGTVSTLGLKLRASIAGKRLHLMRSPDAVCVGGAILAVLAIGEHGSVSETVDHFVREASVVEPDSAMRVAYTQQIVQYQRLHSALRPLQSS
jgi:xylulokinase